MMRQGLGGPFAVGRTLDMSTQSTALMRRGAALARTLVLVFAGLLAGAAPAAAAKGEIRCANSGAYAELKQLANSASPDDFANALAQRLLAEECYLAFVDARPRVRAPKTGKPPTMRRRGGVKPQTTNRGLADLIDDLWAAITAPDSPCRTDDCADDFADAGYLFE